MIKEKNYQIEIYLCCTIQLLFLLRFLVLPFSEINDFLFSLNNKLCKHLDKTILNDWE